jgi:hypothetical protein
MGNEEEKSVEEMSPIDQIINELRMNSEKLDEAKEKLVRVIDVALPNQPSNRVDGETEMKMPSSPNIGSSKIYLALSGINTQMRRINKELRELSENIEL